MDCTEFSTYGFRIGQSRCLNRKSKSGCCLFPSFLPFRPPFSFPPCPLESRNLNLLIPASLFHVLNEGSSVRVKVRKRTVVCIIDPSTSPSIQLLYNDGVLDLLLIVSLLSRIETDVREFHFLDFFASLH